MATTTFCGCIAARCDERTPGATGKSIETIRRSGVATIAVILCSIYHLGKEELSQKHYGYGV